MLGFKRFDTATITIGGIELAEKIRKQQFKIGTLPGRPVATPAFGLLFLLHKPANNSSLTIPSLFLKKFAPEPVGVGLENSKSVGLLL
jgi:hypothetical protein